MPTYVYGCSEEPSHPRVEVVHGMMDKANLWCTECKAPMRKYPSKGMRFYISPISVLYDWNDENWARKRAGRPRFSPDHVNRPGKPIPQRDFEKRSK